MPVGEGKSLASQIALRSHDVVRFLKPGFEFVVQVGFVANGYEVKSPARSVVFGLDDPRTIQPAMQRKTSEEAILTRLKPGEPDSGDAGQSRLLRDDLDIAECVQHGNVLSSKIEYGRF
jgi:hypothetical protein